MAEISFYSVLLSCVLPQDYTTFSFNVSLQTLATLMFLQDSGKTRRK